MDKNNKNEASIVLKAGVDYRHPVHKDQWTHNERLAMKTQRHSAFEINKILGGYVPHKS